MQNRSIKANSARDQKLLNSLIKEPTWAIILCALFLIANVIDIIFGVINYFSAIAAGTEPISILLYVLPGILGALVFLVILIHLILRGYKDALLPGENILFVGEAPVWPVVLCSFLIACSLIFTGVFTFLAFLPEDSMFVALLPQISLLYCAVISLMIAVALVLISVLLLRPKMFLTNKRVIGHGRRFAFKMYSSVPYAAITSVHVTCWHHVCIGTHSGNLHFRYVKNAPKIYKELLKMITAEQKADADYDYDEDEDYDFNYEMSYYAPAYYQQPAPAPIPTPALGYQNGKPIVLEKPQKPRPPKFK